MSDRYYAQMSDKTNLAPWELQIALRDEDSIFRKQLEKSLMGKKVTRKDIVEELETIFGSSLDAGTTKVPLLSLENILKVVKAKKVNKVEMPTGRLKAPYMKALSDAIGMPLEMDTVTVKTMTALLENLNKD